MWGLMQRIDFIHVKFGREIMNSAEKLRSAYAQMLHIYILGWQNVSEAILIFPKFQGEGVECDKVI